MLIIGSMIHRQSIHKLPISGATYTPMHIVKAWPVDRPLISLHSGRTHDLWARWSILAQPTVIYRFDGKSHLSSTAHGLDKIRLTHDPLQDLNAITDCTAFENNCSDTDIAFAGGWIGYISYDLGRWIEPAANGSRQPHDDRNWPLIELAYCPSPLVHDNIENQWHAVGESDLASLFIEMNQAEKDFSVGKLKSDIDPDQYLTMIDEAINYIQAGDIFQANITQRLSASFSGSTRALYQKAMEISKAWYGAYMEFPGGRCITSLSPELFLDADFKSKKITTRPIKGTRPISVDKCELLESHKDIAELYMIVDLMRNDLGRVCEYGSVNVPQPRIIETHPTVHQGVSQITGTLRDGVTISDLLTATFPGGSVTGAPKIRAMQIIDELEPTMRGPYCGAIGYIGDNGHTSLNIAIRTIAIKGTRHDGNWEQLEGTIDYSVGGGIVADSKPIDEYRESMDKAAVLQLVLSQSESNKMPQQIS